MMTLDLKLLVELGDYFLEVELHNWGEPLLSKFIYTMIEEAHAIGIWTNVSTNFSIPFEPADAERLVASGLSVLGVSIEGARQETHEQHRVKGDPTNAIRGRGTRATLVLSGRSRCRGSWTAWSRFFGAAEAETWGFLWTLPILFGGSVRDATPR
jgi:hypothetical protein